MRTLRSGFSRSVERFADREALVVGQHRVTYRELDARARQVAATLDRHALDGEGGLTAVLGHRHPTAFAGILGALMRGHGYVPLNPTFPLERTRDMLRRARCRALVVDPTVYGQLGELLSGLEEPLVVLAPDASGASAPSARFVPHTFLGAADLAPPEACALGDARPEDVAYLLFTSGSTGAPKGVAVTHENVLSFLDTVIERYAIDEHDRFSSTFDLTFDLSVFDLFCAWERGACVLVPTAQEKLFPARYVRRNELTVWFGVPSTAVMMSRLGMLEPDAYPALRWVLFCGEALPVEVAARFAKAAPRAVVENLYGPTELTIACTSFRWDEARARAESDRGLVPIGDPFTGMHAIVVDESLSEVPRGEPGELLMTGPQITGGYWEDPERTARAFVRPPGHEQVFYRTGDRVRWPAGGPLSYLGRVDHQIKIQGYRVELGEVEAVMREVSGAQAAVAVGWPRTPSGADGVVGFVAGESLDAAALLAGVRARLPAYMQPSRIHVVPRLPLGANGKVDREALVRMLGEAR